MLTGVQNNAQTLYEGGRQTALMGQDLFTGSQHSTLSQMTQSHGMGAAYSAIGKGAIDPVIAASQWYNGEISDDEYSGRMGAPPGHP